MATLETPAPPPLAAVGGPCPSCGNPMADDQRYCLQCGERRGAPRVAFDEIYGSAPRGTLSAAAAPAPPRAPYSRFTPTVLAAGGAGLVLILLFGALIGAALSDPEVNVPAARAPIVNVPAPVAAAPAAAVAPATFVSDWAGGDAWTVQLSALPKDGTDPAAVAAAKAAATAQGVTDVGALDSDEYASLDGGQYIVYAGTYPSKKAATAAAKEQQANFPDAAAIEVSATGDTPAADTGADADSGTDEPPAEVTPKELDALENSSGDDYVKKSKKLKDTTVTPGAPPKTDSKPAGGGDEGETLE